MSDDARAIVYLVRHVEANVDPARPEHEWALTPRGERQARDLVIELSALGIETIYSSLYARAKATVEPFSLATGIPINVEHDLRERKLTGGLVGDVHELIKKTWNDFSFALPDGESNAACQSRIVATVERIAGRRPGSTSLVASHGNTIALFMNSRDRTFGFDRWASMKNPDLFRVEFA